MTMTLDKKMKSLSAARRRRVEARAEVLIAEEMSIRELRRAPRGPEPPRYRLFGPFW